MFNLSLSLLSAAVLGACFCAAPASAAVVFYNSEPTFLAAITNPGLDTFNDMPSALIASPINRSAGAHTYTASALNGFFPAGTAGDRWLSINTATDSITFNNFSAGVVGFGAYFFGTDINGNFLAGQSISISATDSSGNYNTILTNTTTGTYLGLVTNSALLSVVVTGIQPTSIFNWPAANNLTLGTAAPNSAVPEPATLAGVGLALAALAFARRNRA